ncbi:MAG TPA: ABC transporter permease [Rugosimonospora sp.]
MTALTLPARNHGHGLRRACRAEITKLAGQWRVRLAAALCVLAPFVLVIALKVQSTIPYDTLFGRWVHESGSSIPLVVLGFCGQWALPALTCLVSGDIFSSEDHFGTWPTILARSCTRRQLFVAKSLIAFGDATLNVVLLALSSTAAGLLLVGRQPLVDLSGTLMPVSHTIPLVLAAWASSIPPVLGFAAMSILISIATRNSPTGIGVPVAIGLGMQLASMANWPDVLRVALLSSSFNAWHGLLTGTPYYGPLVEDLIVSAVYFVFLLGAAYGLAARRDEIRG